MRQNDYENVLFLQKFCCVLIFLDL